MIPRRVAVPYLAIAGLLISGNALSAQDEPAPEAETRDWAELAAKRLSILEVCDLPNAEEDVLCGTIEVFEDRKAQSGRKIGLKVLVVPAQTEKPPPDPVFIFEGGPGGAATKRAMGSIYAGPVRARDIVLVDQRGTGGSNPLHCEWSEEFQDGQLREIFPKDLTTACAKEIAETTDVRFYTTDHFVDDIEEIRKRLGYGPINVRGGSYGTWSMMTFAQRHPESTRSLFGIGMNSPLRSNLAERGVWADRTLVRLAAFCSAEPTCKEIAPDLEAMTHKALERLAKKPLRVRFPDPVNTEETLEIDLGEDWLTEQLRLILYFAFSSRALPWAMHRIDVADDWVPMMTLAVQIERSFRTSLAHGLVLTVQCSEAMDFDVDEALERGKGTLVGNYRLEQQLQGCAIWPHDKLPPLGVEETAVLQTPALFISGALDPVTPPEYAEDSMTVFPDSHHLVLSEGQHGPFDLDNSWVCVHQIWADFLEAGTVENLNTECSESMHRPGFVTDAPGYETYVVEQLIPWSS